MNNTGVSDDVHAFASEQLISIVERIENREEAKKEILGEIKEIYSEASSNGFDVPALRQIIKMRKQDAADRESLEQIVDVYASALGMLSGTIFESAAMKNAGAQNGRS